MSRSHAARLASLLGLAMGLGAFGCHHHHYYTGTGAPWRMQSNLCDPVTMAPVSQNGLCDVPSQSNSPWRVDGMYGSSTQPVVTGSGKPRKVVMSEPSFSPPTQVAATSTDSSTVIAPKVETGGFSDPGALR
jgi:hypothetical protein